MMQELKSLRQKIREDILQKYPSLMEQFQIRSNKNQFIEGTTIDCDGAKLFDDAFHLKHIKNDKYQFFDLKVFIACVAPHLTQEIYQKGKERSANLYLVSEKFDMLPENIQDNCNLIKNTVVQLFSYNFEIKFDQVQLSNITIQNVKIKDNLRFSSCQKILQDIHNNAYQQLNALKQVYLLCIKKQKNCQECCKHKNETKIYLSELRQNQYLLKISILIQFYDIIMNLVNQFSAKFLISQFKMKNIKKHIILVEQQQPEQYKFNRLAKILQIITNSPAIKDLNQQLNKFMKSNIQEHFKELILLQFVKNVQQIQSLSVLRK